MSGTFENVIIGRSGLTALQIAKVLETPLGIRGNGLVLEHRRVIILRYEELKRTGISYSEASRQARGEWIYQNVVTPIVAPIASDIIDVLKQISDNIVWVARQRSGIGEDIKLMQARKLIEQVMIERAAAK